MAVRDDNAGARPRPIRVRRACRLLLAGALAVVLTGCMAGFVYKRLDWVVSWYVNGLVSLDDAQEKQLRAAVRGALQWHRDVQIPAYLAVLEQIGREVAEPVTPQALERHYQSMTVLLDEFWRRVIPEAAALLRTLDPGQVAELRDNFAEGNEELREMYSGTTPEIRRERRKRSTIRAIQRFTGRLTGSQRNLIGMHLAQMQDVSEQWLERRWHWQERILVLVRDPPPEPEFSAALLDMALNPNQFDSPDYRRQVELNRAVIMAMLAEILNGLDARQRRRLQNKLSGFADDLRGLDAGG